MDAFRSSVSDSLSAGRVADTLQRLFTEAENAFDHDNEYLAYVRNPANGCLSQPIPITAGRGNEFTVVTR